MRSIREASLIYGEASPIWARMHEFRHVFNRRFQVFAWENALRPIITSGYLLDRRGIILGSEEELYSRRSRVLEIVRELLSLAATPGWQSGPPDYTKAIMRSFYQAPSHRVAWVMFETCRERIVNRHEKIEDAIVAGEIPVVLCPSARLGSRRTELLMSAGVRLPSRNLHLSLPKGRPDQTANLVRTRVKRKLWTPISVHPLGAIITNWCLASEGEDEADLARGFVPSGLQCRRSDGINAARLIMWYRLDTRMRHGYLESYAIDIDPITGQALSVRYQQADLMTAVGIDPWLNDWLCFGLRHFSK